MSDDGDLIVSAIGAGARDRRTIAEQTGLELRTISNRLFALGKKGEVVKGPDGWELAGSKPPGRHVHLEAAAVDDAPPQRPRKRVAKAIAKVTPPKKAKTRTSPGNGAAPRECEFAIAESGAILFKIVSGPKAGQLGAINHVDAMALYRLMSQVEFITENA